MGKTVSEIVAAARRCIEAPETRRVTLASFDAEGYPSARTMVLPELAADLTSARVNTRSDTRKVSEIGANPKVALSFHHQQTEGSWVTIQGVASLRQGPTNAQRTDILVSPSRLDGFCPSEGLSSDHDGHLPACLTRGGGGWHLPVAAPGRSPPDCCCGAAAWLRRHRGGARHGGHGKALTEVACSLAVADLLPRARRCLGAAARGEVVLLTRGIDGFPSACTVTLLEVAEDLSTAVVRLPPGARQAAELRADRRVALSTDDRRGKGGWLTLKGTASVREAVGGCTEAAVTVARLEGVDYVEGLLGGDEAGYHPALLLREAGAWVAPAAAVARTGGA